MLCGEFSECHGRIQSKKRRYVTSSGDDGQNRESYQVAIVHSDRKGMIFKIGLDNKVIRSREKIFKFIE